MIINLNVSKKDAKDLSRVLRDQMFNEPDYIKKILTRVISQTEKTLKTAAH